MRGFVHLNWDRKLNYWYRCWSSILKFRSNDFLRCLLTNFSICFDFMLNQMRIVQRKRTDTAEFAYKHISVLLTKLNLKRWKKVMTVASCTCVIISMTENLANFTFNCSTVLFYPRKLEVVAFQNARMRQSKIEAFIKRASKPVLQVLKDRS